MRTLSLRSWLLGLLIALPLCYVLFFSQLLRCQLIRYSAEYKQLADSTATLFISTNTPKKNQRQLINNNRQALQRLRNFWQINSQKKLKGQAILIYCYSDRQYQQLCGGVTPAESSAGCSLGTPWGESFLILGPSGNSVDVIAHERCHDELFAQLGWWRTKRQIPQWFNEGLALMVDYRFTRPTLNATDRFRHLHDEWQFRAQSGQEAMALKQLESTHDFFNGNYYHVLLAYLTAATEVARWLSVTEQGGLEKLTEGIRAGGDFEKIYQQLESQHANKPAKNK